MAGEVTSTILSDVILNKHINSAAAIVRSKLALESKKFWQPLESLRIWDSASNAVLPNTAASDDLAIIVGTIGTSGHVVRSSDAKATTITQKAAFTFTLPPEYEDGGAISLTPFAGMKTTVSDTTATIDFSVYAKDAADGTHGSDLVTTSATTINSLTLAAKPFVVTPTSLVAGDELTALMTIAITDGATATAVLGMITKIYWLLEVRG